MKDTDDDEVYTVTPYGLLGTVIDDKSAARAIDALVLYMMRFAKPGHVMGIVAEGGYLNFVQVMKGEPA